MWLVIKRNNLFDVRESGTRGYCYELFNILKMYSNLKASIVGSNGRYGRLNPSSIVSRKRL